MKPASLKAKYYLVLLQAVIELVQVTNQQLYFAIGIPMLFNAGLIGLLLAYINARFTTVERSMEQRFIGVDQRFASIDQRFAFIGSAIYVNGAVHRPAICVVGAVDRPAVLR